MRLKSNQLKSNQYYTMKITVNKNQVANALKNDQYAAWSYAGAMALAEYYEELEECIWPPEELELDVVAIRCEYSEFSSLHDWIIEYYGKSLNDAIKDAGIDLDGEETEEEREELIRDYICDHGQLIEFTGGIIVSSF